jgi:hypothetical protein
MTEPYYTMLSPEVLIDGNVVTAKPFKEGDTPKFSALVGFKPNSEPLLDLTRSLIAFAKEKGKLTDADLGPLVHLVRTGEAQPSAIGWPLKSGTEKADSKVVEKEEKLQRPLTDDEKRDDRRGLVIFTARTVHKFARSIVRSAQFVELDAPGLAMAEDAFSSGNKVMLQVKWNWYPKNGLIPAGCNAYLEKLGSVGEKVPFKKVFGGGKSSHDVFGGYVGKATMVDPLAGLI